MKPFGRVPTFLTSVQVSIVLIGCQSFHADGRRHPEPQEGHDEQRALGTLFDAINHCLSNPAMMKVQREMLNRRHPLVQAGILALVKSNDRHKANAGVMAAGVWGDRSSVGALLDVLRSGRTEMELRIHACRSLEMLLGDPLTLKPPGMSIPVFSALETSRGPEDEVFGRLEGWYHHNLPYLQWSLGQERFVVVEAARSSRTVVDQWK